MNRTCNGQKFKVDERWYWHCLGDGAIIRINIQDGALCPSCRRPVVVTVIEVETRTMIVREICFKDGRNWLPFRTMIL